jgi:hypothetical protein
MMTSSSADRFTDVFGGGRGAGRSDVGVAIMAGEEVVVAASVSGPGVSFRVADAREHLRALPVGLLRDLNGGPGQAGQIVLAAKLCRAQGPKISALYGTRPSHYHVSMDAMAFQAFLNRERADAL